MARKAWIAILGFGLFLFLVLTAFMVWYAAASKGFWAGLGALVWFGLLTWDVYLALQRRIVSRPDKRAL